LSQRVLGTVNILAAGVITFATLATSALAETPLEPAEQREYIAELIVEFFPENFRTMKRIAECESTGMQHREPDGSLIPNRQGSPARGVFQIMMNIHEPEMRRLGLDPNNDRDYMEYVRRLHDQRGVQPWRACVS
jgi:hypothetical protein